MGRAFFLGIPAPDAVPLLEVQVIAPWFFPRVVPYNVCLYSRHFEGRANYPR